MKLTLLFSFFTTTLLAVGNGPYPNGGGGGTVIVPGTVVTNYQSSVQLGGSIHANVTGLVMWMDPALIAATNGQVLATVPDSSGNGNTLLNGGSANVIYSATGMNGAPAIAMPANWNLQTGAAPTAGYALTNLAFNAATMGQNFTFTIALRNMMDKGGTGDNAPLLNSGNAPVLFVFGTNAQAYVQPFNAVAGGINDGPLSLNGLAVVRLEQHYTANVLSLRTTAGNVDIFLNGCKIWTNIPWASFSATGNGLCIGNISVNGVIFTDKGSYNGYVGDIVLASTNESDAEVAVLQQYIMRKDNFPTGPQVYTPGDSIVAGIFASPQSNFTALASSMLPGVTFHNLAVGGMNTSIQLQNLTNEIQMMPAGSIVVCPSPANDLYQGFTLAAIENDITNEVNLIHSYGLKALGMAMPSLAWETGYTATRAQVNGFITNYTGWDALMRFDNDPDMGPAGSYTNSAFYEPAGVHIWNDGYRRLTVRWYVPALQLLLYQQNNANMVTNNQAGVTLAGTFTGNGGALTNASGTSLNQMLATNGDGGGLTNLNSANLLNGSWNLSTGWTTNGIDLSSTNATGFNAINMVGLQLQDGGVYSLKIYCQTNIFGNYAVYLGTSGGNYPMSQIGSYQNSGHWQQWQTIWGIMNQPL